MVLTAVIRRSANPLKVPFIAETRVPPGITNTSENVFALPKWKRKMTPQEFRPDQNSGVRLPKIALCGLGSRVGPSNLFLKENE